MSAALVTIGLTCFNAQDSIARAIASARAQDWPNIEIIIVDDVSTDNSIAAVEAAIAGDPRAQIIRHAANTGPAGARNTILQKAKGEFVAFFDDDDESLPARISTQVAVLTGYETRSGARLIACYASGIRHYPNDYDMNLPAIGSRGDKVPNGAAVADYLLLFKRRSDWFYGTGVPACSLLARRSTFAAAGFFDADLRRVEDADFAIRLALLGGHFIGTPESLFVQYSTGAEDKSPEKNLAAEQSMVEKHRDYLRSIRRYHYARQWPKLRYWHFKRQYGRFLLELISLLARHPLAVSWHLLATGPRRIRHERRSGQFGKRNT
jgi:glycosyltransferase involved in cell wall biosynthesis